MQARQNFCLAFFCTFGRFSSVGTMGPGAHRVFSTGREKIRLLYTNQLGVTMSKSFKAKLQHEGSALGWKIVDIPFDVKKAFGSGGRVPVPRKSGQHFLMLNKTMQKGGGVGEIGDTCSVTIDLDEEERIAEVPEQFAEALEAEDGLRAFYDSFNYSTRKWMCDAVMNPKSEAAKVRRAEELAIQLIQVRDGGEVTPPILEKLFQNNPVARRAWKAMPLSHRHRHLFAIFNYKNPNTRLKRAEKSVEEMAAKAKG
jgi:uncharacterized protein YdeI (YjbR/CyaY-like superfamily)